MSFSNYADIEKHNSSLLENATDLPFPYDNGACLKQVHCLVPKVHCYGAEEIDILSSLLIPKEKNMFVTQRKI